MTEAMPFLRKIILLSYDPRPFLPGGIFARLSGVFCPVLFPLCQGQKLGAVQGHNQQQEE